MALAPGTAVGKYRVVRQIAEGGMAEIYLATQTGPAGFERELCVKRIRGFLSQNREFVEMFISEARVAAGLNHPNIVQIYDFDQIDDSYYIAMELIRGKSLSAMRARAQEKGVRLSPMLAAQLAHELSKGLGYAHRFRSALAPTGVVHRDVTPQNILVSFNGDVKLTDFGIAKVGSKRSTTGMLKGKMAYMSPEQGRGEHLDARTDVFALGIVLWEMLTGTRLFEADSDVQILKAVQQRAIVPPGQLNPQVPAELSDLVMKALDRSPQNRFTDGQDVANALRTVLFAHARDAASVDLAAYMTLLFGETSEHTNVVAKPSRLGISDTARRPGPDDDPHGGTVVPRAPSEGPPPLDMVHPPTHPTLPSRPGNLQPRQSNGSHVAWPRNPAAVAGGLLALGAVVAFATWFGVSRVRQAQAVVESSEPTATPLPMRVESPSPAPSKPIAAPLMTPSPTTAEPNTVATPAPPASTGAPKQGAATEKIETATPTGDDAHEHPAAAPSTRPLPGPRLEVTSAQPVDVYVDGTHIGVGPRSWPLAPGKHVIQVIGRNSGLNKIVPVTATAGARLVIDAK